MLAPVFQERLRLPPEGARSSGFKRRPTAVDDLMSVIVIPIGLLKTYCRGLLDDQGQIELAGREGQTLERVCREIGLPEGLVSLFIVNGRPQSDSYLLQPGDEVKCIAIIGGG